MTMYRFIFAVVAMVFSGAVSASDWEFIGGNEGGEFDVIAVDPNDDDVVFVANTGTFATAVGIFKSDDGGASWARSDTGIATGAGVNQIVFDPVLSTTVYASTSSGLYQSLNGGSTWSLILFGNHNSVAVDPNASNIIYAARIDTVLKSVNSGQSWTVADGDIVGGNFTNLQIDPSDSSILYVTNGDSEIFRTELGGDIWSQVTATGLAVVDVINELHIDPTDSDILYAVVDFDDIYKSIDAGATFSNISVGNQFFNTLAIDQTNTNILYACNQESLYITVNGGQNWAFHSDVFSNSETLYASSTGCRAPRTTSNSQLLYAAGGGGFIRSLDGGQTWSRMNAGLQGAESYFVDPFSPTPGTIYTSSSGGVYVSNDDAESWTRIDGINRISLRQIIADSDDPNILYSTASGSIVKSNDGGVLFGELTLPQSGYSPAGMTMDRSDPGTLYYWTLGGGAYKSTDGGSNWNAINSGLTELVLYSVVINPHAPSRLYAGSETSGFFRSLDGGQNWMQINTGIDDLGTGFWYTNRLVVDARDQDTLYAFSNNALYRSTNNGDSWSPVNTTAITQAGLSVTSMISVEGPEGLSVLYVNGPANQVWRSADGGQTWTPFSNGMTGKLISPYTLNLFASRGKVGDPIYLASLDGVFRSIPDFDGDGFPDNQDDFPTDIFEWLDTDGDGIGNNADTDDDNDGVPDAQDDYPLGRFADAGPGYWAFTFIEALARAGVTAGCGGDDYCPTETANRAQMAVFLERGMRGGGYVPPPATGAVFGDVGASDFAASFIEQLAADGITAGCGDGNYCPNEQVTRAQMAVFLLRAKYGAAYAPPAASGVFTDVPDTHWAAAWIEQLAAEGITSGCGDGNYCPADPVTRAQMAVFLVRTFEL